MTVKLGEIFHLFSLTLLRRAVFVGVALFGLGIGACDSKSLGDEQCKTDETKEVDCNTCTCFDGEWACTDSACMTGGEVAECGDGVQQAPEECDDGNLAGGDGCSAKCTLEGEETEGTGSETEGTSTGTGSEPNETEGSTTGDSTCGDGVVEGEESCDDGNTASGDGCSAECTLEWGGSLICAEPAPEDPFAILDAVIVADTLAVEVQYSGGCEQHDFAVCWDGGFAESDPVQVGIKISHDDKGDLCDALPLESLEFDLSDLKATYQASYQTQNGEISIHLDGWPATLAYVF